MKNILFTSTILFTATISFAQPKAQPVTNVKMEINGSIDQNGKWIYLKQFNGEKRIVVDSAKVNKNKFSFELVLEEPQMIYLSLPQKEDVPIFAQNTKISVQLNEKDKITSTVSGSSIHENWLVIEDKLNQFDQNLSLIYNEYKELVSETDTSGLSIIVGNYDNIEENKLKYVKDYINENPDSYLSAYLVSRFYSYSSDLNELEAYINLFAENKLKSMYIQSIVRRLEDLNKTKLGTTIPDFEQADSNDHNINIKDFRGQYVLIDFWASWCGPCRQENPNIVKAYATFKDQNFTILGVSLDNDKSKWLAAIEKDKLEWSHISDLKGWNNAVAGEFGVKSIPFSIIVDPNGVIIGKDLRGDELQQFLKENLAY